MKITFTTQFQKQLVKLFSNKLIYRIPRMCNTALYSIKCAYQRVVRGFDDTMIWNYHTSMTDMTIEILSILKKDMHGYPSNLKNTNEWKQILTKIIKGFKAMQDIDECNFMQCTQERHKTGIFKGMHKCKINKSMLTKLEKQRDEGFALYVKYYSSLWD